MALTRIRSAEFLDGFTVQFVLTDGRVIARDLSPLLLGGVFSAIRSDLDLFRQMKVEAGTVSWPNGADLCPDVLIYGGDPPSSAEPESQATLAS